MRKAISGIALGLAGLALVSACATTTHQSSPDAAGILHNGSGSEHGAVEIRQSGGKLRATVAASGLAPGMHGAHIHAIGLCDGPDFKSAGGHWNPDNKQHGHANPMGAHRGDLPQIAIASDGTGKAEFEIPGSLSGLVDQDGASLVIHAAPDDDLTDPSGNSGARLLCAIVEPRPRP